MSKIVFEQNFSRDTNKEDSGQALISNIYGVPVEGGNDTNDDTGIHLRVISWDENKEHKDFKKFKNKKVRITIETI